MHPRNLFKLAALAIGVVGFFFAGSAQAATTASVQLSVPGKGYSASAGASSYSVSEAQGTFLLPVSISAGLTGVSGTVVIGTRDLTAVSGTNYGVPGSPLVSGSLYQAANNIWWSPALYSGTYILTWATGDPVTKYISIPIIDSGLNNAPTVQFSAQVISGVLLTRSLVSGTSYVSNSQTTPSGALTPFVSGTAGAATIGLPAGAGPGPAGMYATVSILSAHSTTTAGIKLNKSSYILREPFTAGTTILVPVQIDLARGGDLTGRLGVDFTTAAGTATFPKNFQQTRGNVMWTGTSFVAQGTVNGTSVVWSNTGIAANSSTASAVINVPIVYDPTTAASTPQFTFVLSNPVGGVVTRRSATIRVLDVNAPIPAVEFGSQEFYFPQPTTGVSPVTVPVYRSGTANASFTINSADGSALAPTDYTSLVGYVGAITGGTAAGTEKKDVPLSLNSGSTTIQPLYFTLSLGATGSTAVGDFSLATVYIVTPASVNQATVQLSSPTYLISQASDSINTLQVDVQRIGNLSQTTSVNFLTVPGSAQPGIDYVTNFGTLTFAPGETAKPIDITINPSSSVTGPLQFSIALSNVQTLSGTATGISALGANGTAVVTISPNPQTNVVAFVADSYAASQGTTAQIGVQLDRNAIDTTGTTPQQVTVKVYTRAGTAVAGTDPTIADFVPILNTSPQTLSFTNGETFLTFPVTILSRTIPQSARYFDAVLTTPVNAVLGDQSTTRVNIGATILGTVQFTTTDYLVNEGDGTVSLNVALVRTGSGSVTVPYVVVPGTAPASRYGSVGGGTVTFPPGVSQTQITIPIVDDSVVEAPQTFSVNLQPVTGGTVTLGTQFSAQVTISDNDGDNTVEFENAVYGDTEPVATGPGGKVVPVRVRAIRNGGINVPLAVDYELVPGTAVAGTDYQWDPNVKHTITFAAGESVADISLRIYNDGDAGTTKEFTIVLKQNTSSDGLFTTIGTQSSALFKIYEYDVPTNMGQFLAPELTTFEGGPAVVVALVRNGPYNGANSVVTVQTRMTDADTNYYGDTASPNRDFFPLNQDVTFAILKDIFNVVYGQETLKYVTVPIYDNGLTTGNLFFTIWISKADNLSYGSQLTCRVNIRDAELGNQVQFSQADFPVVRSGTSLISGTTVITGTDTATVSVTLNPTGNSTISNSVSYQVTDITAVNGVDYRAYNGSLTFSPADFVGLQPGQLPTKTISFPLVPSALYVGQSKQFRVTLQYPSSGVYIQNPSTATVTISDPYYSSLPTVSVTVPPSQASISGTSASNGAFVITRTGTNGVDLLVNYLIKGTAIPGPIANSTSDNYDYLYIGSPLTSPTAGIVSAGSVSIPAGSQSISIPVTPHTNPNSKTASTVELQIDAAPENAALPGKVTYLPAVAKSGTVTVQPAQVTGINVTMNSGTTTQFHVGDQIMLTSVIRNTGGTDRTNVVLTQTFPTSVTFVSCDWDLATTATAGALNTVKVPVGIVESGVTDNGSDTEVIVNTVVTVNSPIIFEATSSLAASNLDSYTADDKATVRVTVKRTGAKPSISIYGSGDAYELIPLVSPGGYNYLGQFPGSFVVTRSSSAGTVDVSSPLTVNYTVVSSTVPALSGTVAEPGTRYTPLTGSVTILAGTNSASIPVDPKYSALVTGDQSVTLNLAASTTYDVGSPSSAHIYIRDAESPVVSVAATTPNASEQAPLDSGTVSSTYKKLGLMSGYFTLTRSDTQSNPLRSGTGLNLNCTIGGTAVSGSDYNLYVAGSLVQLSSSNNGQYATIRISTNSPSVRVEVRPIANRVVEGTRTVTLSINDPVTAQNNGNTVSTAASYTVATAARSALVSIYDKQTLYFTQNSTDRTAIMGGKYGYITVNRSGSGLKNVLIAPIVPSGTAQYGVDYRIYQGAVERRSSVVFPAGTTSVRLTIKPIKHTTGYNVLPLVLTLPATTYYQTSSNTYRGIVNILPK